MVLDEGVGGASSPSSDVDSDSVIRLVACALPSSAFRASSTILVIVTSLTFVR